MSTSGSVILCSDTTSNFLEKRGLETIRDNYWKCLEKKNNGGMRYFVKLSSDDLFIETLQGTVPQKYLECILMCFPA